MLHASTVGLFRDIGGFRLELEKWEKRAVSEVRKQLTQDHEDHERLLKQLAASLEAKRPPAELRERWSEFEANLFDHMETEERSLFSVAAQAHRLEIEKLRSEHRQIRQALFGMAVSVELHTLKKNTIDELLDLLHAHTEHEQKTLHHWIEVDEGIMARRGVLAIRSRRERSSARLRAASERDE